MAQQEIKNFQDYSELGANLLLDGKYEEAEKAYRQAINLESNYPWLHCNLGRSLLHQEKIEAAIPYFEKAIELSSEIAEAWFYLAEALTKQQRFPEAVTYYQKAIELEPNQFLYHHQLGDNFLLQRKYEEAVFPYQKAIELNPEYAWSYHNLGNALSELSHWEEAIKIYQKAVEFWPENPDFHYGLGHAKVQLGSAEDGVSEYRRSIDLKTQSVSSFQSQNPIDKLQNFIKLEHPRILVLSKRESRIFSQLTNIEIQQYFRNKNYDLTFCSHLSNLDIKSFDAIILLIHLYDELTTLKSLRSQGFSGLLIGWFWDNHHHYYENIQVVDWVDICIPGHGFTGEIFKGSWNIFSEEAVPLCSTQWTIEQAQEFFNLYGNQERSNQLYGGFTRYDFASQRNSLITQVQQKIPNNKVCLFDEADQEVYFGLNSEERFAQWTHYKVSLCLPLEGDLSQRFFDALLCGQIPILPESILDLDQVISPLIQESLPIIRFQNYTVENVQQAYEKAIHLFEEMGVEGITRRHKFVLENHMFVHRLQRIIDHLVQLAANCKQLTLNIPTENQLNSAEFWRQIGIESEQKGDINKMIDAYSQAIKIEPAQSLQIYHHLMEKLQEKKDFAALIQLGRMGLTLYPEDVKIARQLAASFIQQGDYREAEEILNLLASKYREPWIIRELVEAQEKQGKLDEALNNIRTANEILPGNCWLRWDLARLLKQKGYQEEAIGELQLLIDAKDAPNWIKVQFLKTLGELLEDKNKAQANLYYCQAFQLDQNNITLKDKVFEALQSLSNDFANLCLRYHLWEESEKMYRCICILNPENHEARFRLGNSLEKLGKQEEALSEYQACLELESDNVMYLEKIGDILSSKGGCYSFRELSFP